MNDAGHAGDGEAVPGDERDGSEAAADPSDAFGVASDPTRLATLRALYDDGACPELGFTELFEATGADTTAGFAYHLRQLTGTFLARTGDRYRLTDAGRRLARALAAGAYTDSATRDPFAVDDPCPFCGGSLRATAADNVVTIGCLDCDRTLLSLPFPPAGHGRDDADLLAAFDRYHRHRIAALSDGICPDCGGRVDGEASVVEETAAGASSETEAGASGGAADRADHARARAAFACRDCGLRLRCPVTLAVRSNPAVVSLYEDHGIDVRERPVWNVGDEWTERVLSREPVCVEVTAAPGEERLTLLVGRDLTVVATDGAAGDGTRASDAERDADAGTATG